MLNISLDFTILLHATRIVVAVSGGPDSITLMHSLYQWQQQLAVQPDLIVASVDHGLRPGSASETAFVKEEAEKLGLQHHILLWEGQKPFTGVQQAAREARYRLLFDLCQSAKATHLVTAHTMNDHAETVLMRMAAGSGLMGLAGMRNIVNVRNIKHVRPFLHISKKDLLHLAGEQGWPYIHDPSNNNSDFSRVRWRTIMPRLAEEGLTAKKLTILSQRISRANEALDQRAEHVLKQSIILKQNGVLCINGKSIFAEPDEIGLRVVIKSLYQISDSFKHNRLQRAESCFYALKQAWISKVNMQRTLSGCVLILKKDGLLTIKKEGMRQRGLSK